MRASYRASKAAQKKAASAIRRNKRVGNRCMTHVGKMRAQQIAQGKVMSVPVLVRTKNFLVRSAVFYNPSNSLTCGSIAFDGWGGQPMLESLQGKQSPLRKR